MRLSFLACVSSVGFLVVACSGADTSDLFGAPGSSSGSSGSSSGASSGGSSGTSSGGSSGTSSGGSSGTSSGGSSGSSDAGLDTGKPVEDAGRPCNPALANPCGAGAYCDAPNCTTPGVCKTPGAEVDTQDIVCGCDGITYWNPSVAQNFGTTVGAKNSCSTSAAATKKCSTNTACGGSKTKCQMQVANGPACLGNNNGICWRLPGTCPVVANSTMHTCDIDSKCTSLCKAIEKEQAYYSGATCTVP